MDRGAWWAPVHRVAQSQTRLERRSTHSYVEYVDTGPVEQNHGTFIELLQ